MSTSALIPRDELVARLDRAAARKVTIISGPTGSGKTSLLRAWAERPDRGYRVAFVTVRCDDPDASVRTFADRVLSEFTGHSGNAVLVLDDLHELRSPESLAEVSGLLANLPPQLNVIVATLAVSLNTVSTHIRRIFAKLGANNRSCAVQRARELGLLS